MKGTKPSETIGGCHASQQQQQQQHSFFPQTSWGRLEMKPERKKVQGSGTLIASLQALLSKAISLEIFQSLRSPSLFYSRI